MLQVPLTYRDAPLAGGADWLVGTIDHSVLGRRWVYDACGDPVYANALANAIFTGSGQADEFFEIDGRVEHREPVVLVNGSGAPDADVPTVTAVLRVEDNNPTLIVTDLVELSIIRVLDALGDSQGGPGRGDALTLAGTWAGQSTPRILARATRR